MARCTKGAWGFCVRHECRALDESGQWVKVSYGNADTYFTAPARTMPSRGKAVYGFVTGDEMPTTGDKYLRFVAAIDQPDAKMQYRESIKL